MTNAQVPALQEKTRTIRDLFEKDTVRKQIQMAIPRHMSVDRLLRVAVTAIRANPKLLDCTKESLLACVMGCAQLGLEPEPFLGQAYLVPYWSGKKKVFEAQLIPGYRGYLALARRSGEVNSVISQVVYTNDHFELRYGLNATLDHVPAEGDRGEPKGVYVVFHYKDGSYSFDYMSKADIEKIRARSKSKDDGPWVTDWDEMAKKTVIRRHIKVVPLSVEMVIAAAAEDRYYAGEAQMGLFMEPGADGTEQLPDPGAIFARQVEEKAAAGEFPLKDWNKFMQACADTYKISLDEVKAQIATPEDFANLWNTFEKWRLEQQKSAQKPPEKTQEQGQDKTQGVSGAASGPPRTISDEILEELRKVPEDIIKEGFEAFGIPADMDLAELDEMTAVELAGWARNK
jgi:recombination protein RecT